MFKKSRRKIVATIMSILVCLFIGTLAVIYASSYYEVANTNFDMLERYAQTYVLADHIQYDHMDNLPPGWMEPLQGKDRRGKPFNTPAFQLSTFYSVAVADNGQILATDIGDREVYNGATLEEYAADILKNGKVKGTKGSLVYLVEPKNGYTLVAFMDNTVTQESMTTLFRYTLVFGSIALVVMFLLSRYLAKRIVDPLERSYLKQKQFVSDAGHELKTPVSVVNTNAEILQREIGENRWLANIQYENERMGKLVTQLLELARTEDVKPQMEHLDFSRLVAGGVLPFESVAFENGLMINTQIADGVSVMGNSTQLSQLVSILVDNAIRHGQGGKEILVSLTQNRSTAILSVINAGEAIPPEKTEQLFERFYRTDEARTEKDNHYGLGLAITKAIVEAHKGKIEVHCHNGLVEFRATVSKS
ncbi:MAG: HAMP domain-containing sensor histidine kinase [Oscillospiraceae bacterium]|nr:HAMP domain-containing sensor histidine kinase [Oscillospiraceae bacterium]